MNHAYVASLSRVAQALLVRLRIHAQVYAHALAHF